MTPRGKSCLEGVMEQPHRTAAAAKLGLETPRRGPRGSRDRLRNGGAEGTEWG